MAYLFCLITLPYIQSYDQAARKIIEALVADIAGFGIPHSRRRVFIIASWQGDARDVLLTQVELIRCMSLATCIRTYYQSCEVLL